MTFLPLIDRELRVRARARTSYWLRFGVGLAGVVFFLPHFFSIGAPPAMIGKGVFQALSGTAFVLCCGATLVAADTLSRERREGTLGLLFLTRVKAFDVVVGKLGSVGVSSMCAVVALLPVLMVPLLAGGVANGEAIRKGLTLLVTLFLALCLGLYASARQGDRSKAAARSVLLLLAVLLVPLLFGHLLGHTRGPTVVGWLSSLSPLYLFESAGDMAYRADRGTFWFSMVAVLVMGGALLAMAAGRLRLSVREGVTLASVGGTVDRRGRGSEAARSSSERLPLRIGERSPVEWLVLRQRGIRRALWMGAVLTAFFPFVGRMFYGRFAVSLMPSYLILQLPYFGFSLLAGMMFAWIASRFFLESRRSGALELLLTTPVGARNIVSGQWHSLRRRFIGPVVVMLLPFLLQLLFLPMYVSRGMPAGFFRYSLVSVAFGTLNLLLEIGALCWVGMWYGLTAKSLAGAIACTLGRVKVAPYFLSLFGMVFSQVLAGFLAAPPFGFYQIAWLPQLAITLYYIWTIRTAKQRLLATLAGAEPATFGSSMRDAARRFRAARHWTPPV